MIFVMFTHLNYGWTMYYVITGPIMLPLFFMATGFTFNAKRTFPEFLKVNIFKRIVVPLLVLSLYPLRILQYAILDRNPAKLWEKTYELISGKTLWYLNCLIFASIIFYIVRKLSRKNWQVYLSCVILSVFGFILNHFGLLDFCCINTAFIAQLYLCAGFFLKEHNNFEGTRLMKRPRLTILSAAALYAVLVAVTVTAYPGEYLDLHNNRYYNPLVSLVMIACGCFAMVQIVSRCGRLRVLEYVGKNSLVFYCLHTWGFVVVRTALSIAGVKIPWLPAERLAVFAGSCIGCSICAWLINRYIPFIAGGSRRTIPAKKADTEAKQMNG